MITPDITGFEDAQRRLRQLLGAQATFRIPNAPTWAPNEPLDPDTGRPFDPFAVPTTGGDYAEVVKRVSFVARPLTSGRALGGDTIASPIGNVDDATAAVIIDITDYPDVQDAVRVDVAQVLYDIENWRHDTLGPAERWIAYLEKA